MVCFWVYGYQPAYPSKVMEATSSFILHSSNKNQQTTTVFLPFILEQLPRFQEEEPAAGEKHFKENHLMILMEYQSSKQSIWKFITKEGENYCYFCTTI